jgi:hypothetical protein
MNPMRPTVEPFSAGYFLVNADVVQYTGDKVVMAHDLFGELVNHVKRPLLRLGDSHYWPTTGGAIPADTIALPEWVAPEEGAPVLMAKDGTALRLLETGQEQAPI